MPTALPRRQAVIRIFAVVVFFMAAISFERKWLKVRVQVLNLNLGGEQAKIWLVAEFET